MAPTIGEEERYDVLAEVDKKAQTLVEQIKKSKHFIAFTGAGVSTSAGIPDFRGPEGNWTLRAQGRERGGEPVNTLQAIPTPRHMALVALQNRGILKYLVSQNCDGLHRRSGILPNKISELHGNTNREICKDCGKEYLRDYRAVASYEHSDHDHRTGRKCASCGGVLHDTIVNFDEFLPAIPLELARSNAKKADLCLVLRSSLTVPPANTIPESVGKRKSAKLAICNLQTTEIDKHSSLRIYAKTDDLMIKVMEKLEIPIPTFILQRHLVIEMETKGAQHKVTVSGVDVDGTSVTFLRSVKLEGSRRAARSEPFVINFRDDLESGAQLKLELEFMGHYGEPNLEVTHEYDAERNTETSHLLEYNPQTGEWKTSIQGGLDVIDLTGDDSMDLTSAVDALSV
ncbi:NAD-dependent protein deacetylase SRT1 [Lachnellula suecica]|uniref:protein acetyllysine N-acetyltransferase n=1 Tax=Lachnellula suecica TaxID=602035 RepID=A0A8T9CDY7_9HELO|nr:NAD-dependent protein deacetylase SRT1 [Lachnellula suecica]